MPKLSGRGQQMPESPIRKLVPFAEAAEQRGTKVYYLNIGQPDIKTPQVVLDALAVTGLEVIEYSHSAGFKHYREGIAEYYRKLNLPINAEDVLITTGGSEALLFSFMTCFNEGDEVIIPEPFYANYNGFAKTANIKIVPVTSRIEDGFALPPIADFEKLITEKTKGILICNPGNPTGYLYSKEELETLRGIVLKHNLFLFADEVYREFCYDGKQHHSVLSLKGIEDNVIVIDSVSKRYSMCGARVGAMISKNKDIIATALKYGQARLSPPTLGQIAGVAALNTPQSYFDDVLAKYDKRRKTLVEGLNAIDGVFCPTPGGAFYAVAQLPIDDADKFCRWMLESFEYKGQTVMMAPATGFYATPGLGKNQVRIAYVLQIESLEAALECLKEGLAQYPGRVETPVPASSEASR